jgi:predicted lipid-binding transport protein (Tim44 family)
MSRFSGAFGLTAAALGCLLISACGSAAGATSAPVQPVTSAASPTATSASVTPSSSSPASAATQKVNANTATQAELQAAFTAAGINNAGRWAVEVAEYRPYPTDDPTFAKLRGELAKYNPGQATVDQIIATLSL